MADPKHAKRGCPFERSCRPIASSGLEKIPNLSLVGPRTIELRSTRTTTRLEPIITDKAPAPNYYRPQNFFGIGALTLAIIAACTVWIPKTGLIFGIPTTTLAIGFGVVGIVVARRNPGGVKNGTVIAALVMAGLIVVAMVAGAGWRW
jgi:hypothetical protein